MYCAMRIAIPKHFCRDILLVTDSLNNMIFGRGSRRNGRQRAVAPVGGDQAAPVPTYASAYSRCANEKCEKNTKILGSGQTK